MMTIFINLMITLHFKLKNYLNLSIFVLNYKMVIYKLIMYNILKNCDISNGS